jgi:hypothetical protein
MNIVGSNGNLMYLYPTQGWFTSIRSPGNLQQSYPRIPTEWYSQRRPVGQRHVWYGVGIPQVQG